MTLHNDKALFKDAITITAEQMNIPAIYVEKDYWVTYALYNIFNNEIGKETVFKGGTALLKCYRFIQRFSEDIDLVVLRTKDETDSQLKTKLKKITSTVSNVLPEVNLINITKKLGMIRKTAHAYAKTLEGDFGQVRDVIVIEATWLGYYEPYTTKTINSFIYEMMQRTGQQKLAEEYGLLPFEVLVLEPTRTICEKIMSLVRFSHTEQPIEDLQKKIRHTYDLHQLLQNEELQQFFESKSFDEMLLKVANDDIVSFKNNNDWLQHHPKEALIFADTEGTWEKIKDVYKGDFKNLTFGDFPKEEQILEMLKSISHRISEIEWQINQIAK